MRRNLDYSKIVYMFAIYLIKQSSNRKENKDMSSIKKFTPLFMENAEKAFNEMDKMADAMMGHMNMLMDKVSFIPEKAADITANVRNRFENLLNNSMKTEKNKYTFLIEVPSVMKKEDLELRVEDNTLFASGELHNENNSSHYSFATSVIMPSDVLTDKIDAELKNGTLYVTAPRKIAENNIKKNQILIK